MPAIIQLGTVKQASIASNREDWLQSAVGELRPLLIEAEAPEFLTPHVSVGWAKGARGGNGKTIGQCWDKRASGDKERAHIFISPELTDPIEVLAVLLHEMVHAAVGTECGHRGPFRKVAKATGLEGKMTATFAGEILQKKLGWVRKALGEYPHPGLNGQTRKKPGSRMIKVQCWSCGCIARMTRKWIELLPPPTCGCGCEMEVEL